jgi:hypothetical protein
MTLSRCLQPLFFIFALLFVQQSAVVHGISHTLAEQSQNHSLPHDKHCDLCAAYAQVGGAISSDIVHFDFTQAASFALGEYFAVSHVTQFNAFSARAPPLHPPQII